MAFSTCKKDASWFTACRSGDAEQIKKMAKSNARRRDARTQEQDGITGFTGLMYAVYFCQNQALAELYELEWDMCVEDPTVITCKTLESRYNLQPGSNVLFLAMAAENEFAVDHILHNPKTFLGYKNAIGYTASLFSIAIDSIVGRAWVFNYHVFSQEITSCSLDGMSALSNCGYFGRLDYIYKIFEIASGKCEEELFQANTPAINAVKKQLVSLCKQVDSDGMTPLDVCEEIVNYEKVKTSEEYKAKCHELIEQLSTLGSE